MAESMTTLDAQLRKKKALTYTLLQVVGILALMLVGNCFDWLNMKFDPTQLKTWNYWNGVIQQVLMYSIALVIGYTGRMEREFLNNKEFALAMNLYHRFLGEKTESFVIYVNKTLNPKIKREYYISHVERKLYRLEERSKRHDDWKLEYDKILDDLTNGRLKSIKEYACKNRQLRQYVVRRFTLEALIHTENVEKNCRSFNRYPRVNAHSFTWGVRSKSDRSNKYKVENTLAKDLSVKVLQKALSVVLMAVVLGSIAGDPSKNELLSQVNGWAKLIIKYIIRVGGIAWSYISGLYLGKGMFESNYIEVVNNRNDILESYLSWKKELKEEETEGYKIRKALMMSQTEEFPERRPLEDVSKRANVTEESKNPIELTEEEKQKILEQALNEKRKNELLKQALDQ